MAEHTRKDPRAKVLSMTVRYKSATLDEFIEHHSHDVSRGGMYIKTPQPFPPGTLLKFEVKIAGDQRVMQGVGRVVWRREADDASPEHPSGMGVKFIKLDDESKSIIDQLVTARVGDISAFDEVAPQTDLSQPGIADPTGSGTSPSAGSDDFFPKSTDNTMQPAPEDRTVMKQATELLQEALREVGGGSGSEPARASAARSEDAIPKAPKVAAIAPAQAHEKTPRYQRIPTPVAASSVKPVAPPDTTSTRSRPASVGAFEPSAPNVTNRPVTESSPKTVPATPMAARRGVQASPAPKGEPAQYKLPQKQRNSPNWAVRVGVGLLLLGGSAAAVFALTRKPAPPPAPETAPVPSVQKLDTPPPVINVVGNPPDAAGGPSADAAVAATASASAEPPAVPAASAEKPVASEKPAVPEVPKSEPVVKPRVQYRKKADAGAAPAVSARPLDTADELYPTPAPAPAKTSESAGAADPAPASTGKSKSKSAAPAPAPTTTEESAQ